MEFNKKYLKILKLRSFDKSRRKCQRNYPKNNDQVWTMNSSLIWLQTLKTLLPFFRVFNASNHPTSSNIEMIQESLRSFKKYLNFLLYSSTNWHFFFSHEIFFDALFFVIFVVLVSQNQKKTILNSQRSISIAWNSWKTYCLTFLPTFLPAKNQQKSNLLRITFLYQLMKMYFVSCQFCEWKN